MITYHQDCVLYEIGRDGWGNVVKKNEQYLKCRVKEKYQLVKDKAAIEQVSEFQIDLPPSANVKLDYLIEYESKEYSIISIRKVKNTIGELTKWVVFI